MPFVKDKRSYKELLASLSHNPSHFALGSGLSLRRQLNKVYYSSIIWYPLEFYCNLECMSVALTDNCPNLIDV